MVVFESLFIDEWCASISSFCFQNKRVRDRKVCHQDSYQSKRGLSMNYERNRASEDKTNFGLSHSSSYASSDSSSCSGSISESKNSSIITKETCSKNQELEEKPEKVDMLDCSSFNSGIYLLVISLIITILLGKLCAIIFTSILVYFVPRQRYDRQEDVIRLAKPKSRDYRKGVIPWRVMATWKEPQQRALNSWCENSLFRARCIFVKDSFGLLMKSFSEHKRQTLLFLVSGYFTLLGWRRTEHSVLHLLHLLFFFFFITYIFIFLFFLGYNICKGIETIVPRFCSSMISWWFVALSLSLQFTIVL